MHGTQNTQSTTLLERSLALQAPHLRCNPNITTKKAIKRSCAMLQGTKNKGEKKKVEVQPGRYSLLKKIKGCTLDSSSAADIED